MGTHLLTLPCNFDIIPRYILYELMDIISSGSDSNFSLEIL
jgi:hypothetical protein